MDQELLDAFREESAENLKLLESSISAIRAAPADPAAAKTLFRAAHTLSGIASSLGFDEIAQLAKPLEKALAPIRDGKKIMDQDTLQLAHECRLAIGMLCADGPGSVPGTVVSDLLKRLASSASL